MMRFLVIFFLCAGVAVAQPRTFSYREGTPCVYLDVRADPVFSSGLEYVFPASAINNRDWSLMIYDLDAEWLFFRDVLLGDLDLGLNFRMIHPLQEGGLDFPDGLLALALDVRWTWRYVNDIAFQLRLEPGLYTAMDAWQAESLAMPVGLVWIRTIHSSLTALAGISFRMQSQRPVMPIAGLVWQPFDALRMEALIPTGRIRVYPLRHWSAEIFWDWNSVSYAMDDDDPGGQLTLEESRVGLGVTHELSPEWRISLETGLVGGRSLIYEHVGEADTARAMFIRLALGGAF